MLKHTCCPKTWDNRMLCISNYFGCLSETQRVLLGKTKLCYARSFKDTPTSNWLFVFSIHPKHLWWGTFQFVAWELMDIGQAFFRSSLISDIYVWAYFRGAPQRTGTYMRIHHTKGKRGLLIPGQKFGMQLWTPKFIYACTYVHVMLSWIIF